MQAIEITMTAFSVITVIILFIYIYSRYRVTYIKPVAAGDDSAEDVAIGTLSKNDYIFYRNNGINPRKYKFMQVRGNCMKLREIYLDDIVLIEKFPFYKSNESKGKMLKKGDVLFINFIDEKSQRKIKLREFVSINEKDKNSVDTLRYNDDGTIRCSKKPHRLKDIHGVVRYVDHWEKNLKCYNKIKKSEKDNEKIVSLQV